MLAEYQIDTFIKQSYQAALLQQIPPSYTPNAALLTLTLNLDLLRIFKTNRQIGVLIVSKYPLFYECSLSSIVSLFKNNGISPPQYGIDLIVKITNCPLPTQNIASPQFYLAALEQEQGIMVYFPVAVVLQIGQPSMYLFSYTQVWAYKCNCNEESKKKRKMNKPLIDVVKYSRFQKGPTNKKLSDWNTEPCICESCEKPLVLCSIEDQIFMNCERLKISIPKNLEDPNDMKFSLFSSNELQLYADSKSINRLKVGDQISCCCYIFCRQNISNSMTIGAKFVTKPVLNTFMISCFKYEAKGSGRQKQVEDKKNKFLSQILNKGNLVLKNCQSLSNYDLIMDNYNNLIDEINKIRFPYLEENTFTVFKLSVLNSVFNSYILRDSLSMLLIVEDLQAIAKALNLENLSVNVWPSDYDQATLRSWLITVRQSIVTVMNPTKKDLKFIDGYLKSNEQHTDNAYNITFWILSEQSIKKQINLNYFPIVLDLTSQKNINICRTIIDESIDRRLSAFLTQPEEQHFMNTIHKVCNRKERICLVDTFKRQGKCLSVDTQHLQRQEHKIAMQILQRYFLKSRQLKKTDSVAFEHLIKLAEGFTMLIRFLSSSIRSNSDVALSVLAVVLAIFLDEETSRHKYSNSNTIFGTDVSKVILNEQNCDISFWDYECSEEGTLREIKDHMSKEQMMKRMLYRLNELIYEDQLLILQDL